MPEVGIELAPISMGNGSRAGARHVDSVSDLAKTLLPKKRVVLIGYLRVLKYAFRARNGHFNGDGIRLKASECSEENCL